MNTILVPTNLNQVDRSTFRYALELAMHYNWGLKLAHVWPLAFAPSGEPIYIPNEHMQQALDLFFKSIDLTSREVTFLEKTGFEKPVLEGPATPVLLNYAERIGATMIVVSSPKKSGLDRLLLGTVPADLAQSANCPVLLVPERAVFGGFEQIVFATDHQSLKSDFLNRAIDLTNEFRSFIKFLHVTNDFLEGEQVHEQLMEALARDHKPLFGSSWNQVDGKSVERGLLDWLLENPADLIILATHQRGFFDSLTHHSVTAGMAKRPFLPILVFHEEDAVGSPEFDVIRKLRLV